MSKELPRHGRVIREFPQHPFLTELKYELVEIGVPEEEVDTRARKEFLAAKNCGETHKLTDELLEPGTTYWLPKKKINSGPHTPRIKNKLQVVVTKTKPKKGL